MKLTRQSWKHFLIGIGVPVLLVSSSAPAAVTEKDKVRQPRNIYELSYSFRHTFAKILSNDEMRLYERHTPKEIRELNPALYARISVDVKRWTDEWIQHILTTGDPIPEQKLEGANRLAVKVEGILKQYFEARGWPYRPMRVVFIPPRAFQDDRDRGKVTGGMFIPFYPDAFFATVDWTFPIETLLVHESLHFNAEERPFGAALVEGVTDVASRHLVRKYDLVSAGDVRRVDSYPTERKGVEFVLDRLMEKSGRSRDEAVDMLLGAYLTGDQNGLTSFFGAEAWGQVLRISHYPRSWRPGNIDKALEGTIVPVIEVKPIRPSPN